MSTRCQVRVQNRKSQHVSWDEAVTLYHHTDGYPENMVPLIHEAFVFPTNYGTDSWQKGRAGKAASFLCAADPGIFEPEDHHELHGDIEYYYIVNVSYENNNPTWFVDVYGRNWDAGEPSLKNMKHIEKNVPITELIKKYPVD